MSARTVLLLLNRPARCLVSLYRLPVTCQSTKPISTSKTITPFLKTLTNLPCQQTRSMSATKTVPPLFKANHNMSGGRPRRHRDPLWKRGRKEKNWKIELQDFEYGRRSARGEVTPEEAKAKMKKLGLRPMAAYQEKPIYISSTGTILQPYIPPEGDGKASLVSTTRAKQLQEAAMGKGRTMASVRKIRRYDEDFDPRDFAEAAQQIYIDAHRALADGDEDALHKLATEKCFPEMMNTTKRKTIRWNFLKSLEPPRVVYARHAEILTKENMFAQLTVRFHTQQTLAVYDRFGRLIHGSETIAKDVLEYVVFEKHLANVYGVWRIHAKIIPDWMPPREPGRLTYLVEKEKEKSAEDAKDEQEEVDKQKEEHKDLIGEDESLYDRFGRMIGKK